MSYFNSITVRLERNFNGNYPIVPCFQFHKGTIRTRAGLSYKLLKYLFQFHKGTIRTRLRAIEMLLLIVFQFHKGTIRTFKAAGLNPYLMNFNSIKVRLEPPSTSDSASLISFQFHKGTIRTDGQLFYNLSSG